MKDFTPKIDKDDIVLPNGTVIKKQKLDPTDKLLPAGSPLPVHKKNFINHKLKTLVVEDSKGRVFTATQEERIDILSGIMSLDNDTETMKWQLYDNTFVDVTRVELKEVLKKATQLMLRLKYQR